MNDYLNLDITKDDIKLYNNSDNDDLFDVNNININKLLISLKKYLYEVEHIDLLKSLYNNYDDSAYIEPTEGFNEILNNILNHINNCIKEYNSKYDILYTDIINNRINISDFIFRSIQFLLIIISNDDIIININKTKSALLDFLINIFRNLKDFNINDRYIEEREGRNAFNKPLTNYKKIIENINFKLFKIKNTEKDIIIPVIYLLIANIDPNNNDNLLDKKLTFILVLLENFNADSLNINENIPNFGNNLLNYFCNIIVNNNLISNNEELFNKIIKYIIAHLIILINSNINIINEKYISNINLVKNLNEYLELINLNLNDKDYNLEIKLTKSVYYNIVNLEKLYKEEKFKNLLRNINKNSNLNLRIIIKKNIFDDNPILLRSLQQLDEHIQTIFNTVPCMREINNETKTSINPDYYKNSLYQSFFNSENYDSIFIINNNIYIGLSIVKKINNDIDELNGIFEKNLVCSKSINNIPIGSILQSLYLIFAKYQNMNIGFLELASSYENVDAYCMYNKFGFKSRVDLLEKGFLKQTHFDKKEINKNGIKKEYAVPGILPMVIDLKNISIENILNILLDINYYFNSNQDIYDMKNKDECKYYYNNKKDLKNKLKNNQINPLQFKDAILNLYNKVQYNLVDNGDQKIKETYNKVIYNKIHDLEQTLISYLSKPIITSAGLLDLYNFIDNIEEDIESNDKLQKFKSNTNTNTKIIKKYMSK